MGNIIDNKVNVKDIRIMDLKQLYEVNVVAYVNAQNEIVAHNKARRKHG